MTKIPLSASDLADALEQRNRSKRHLPAEGEKILTEATAIANKLLTVIAPSGVTTVGELNAILTALAMIVARIVVETADAEPDNVCAGITDFLGAVLANSDDFIEAELHRRRMN